MKKKIQDAINEQINNEFYASYLYLSMSAFCQRQSLSGFAKWLRLQSREETGHGMKLYDFLADCDGKIVLREVKAPPTDFDSILALAEQVLEHEKRVTDRISALYELATKEKHYALQNHLHWFITEQVEEESSARYIVDKLKLIKEDTASLLALDRELGERETAE